MGKPLDILRLCSFAYQTQMLPDNGTDRVLDVFMWCCKPNVVISY